jgi:glutamate-ammonia-ligase adenylyltransferase
MFAKPWSAALIDELQAMRQKLESTASPNSLKRGRGGLVDVEFIVQLLQLKYGRDHPAIRRSNAWEALEALAAGGFLSAQDAATLQAGYSFLRLVEARLRIVTDRPLTEIPADAEDLAKLAARLGFDFPEGFLNEWKRVAVTIRTCFDAILANERKE